jgi:hypothetical protein
MQTQMRLESDRLKENGNKLIEDQHDPTSPATPLVAYIQDTLSYIKELEKEIEGLRTSLYFRS